METTKKPEVLAPAGDKEKLRMAAAYGADAVYLAGPGYGMRAGAGTFGPDDMAWAMACCHERDVKVYVTVNTIPTDGQMAALPGYLESLESAGADGLIVSDLGVLALAKKYAPHAAVHISTQAGVLNGETARMFYDLGAARVVLAREMSLDQIARLRANTPKELELEAFCHGAMCVSFSGRCVLSNYLTGRDANQGACAQPCRWKYHIVEEKRPGEYMEITEDGGTYLYNSRDMCMIDHVPALLAAGVTSLKIEGRTKSAYYAAAVTNAYRHAVDAALAGQPLAPVWRDEVMAVSHRPYSTGFYFGQPGQYTDDACYFSRYDVMAVVESCDENGRAALTQRNRFSPGEELELLMPGREPVAFTAGEISDAEGAPVAAASHPKMELRMRLPCQAPALSFLRRRRTEDKPGHRAESALQPGPSGL